MHYLKSSNAALQYGGHTEGNTGLMSGLQRHFRGLPVHTRARSHPAPLTCPVARAVEVYGKGAALMLRLPGGRGAILVVGVGVVVVDVLPGEDGRA